ncbi:multi-sensor signal transduction multi-kinase [[Leptolyngbya] sp. PCC 7376]|uniref:AAA family ATPase n=1 Tax=[Leptolyngbya] sp. PCC 7376 TaxID=111781 RepID=UPI00029EF4A6|nr:AAA family ATPase [[Leptolyngbya] sp. PCC 7376]AFY38081.1 multi-sensor signal transduction multi-kinase [[Leptolyngbya] sp. PCC 7376]
MTSVFNQAITQKLPGYTFVKTIYRGTRTTVYKAVADGTQQPVAIKVLSHEYPSFAELVQFRNQYTITKNLPVAGIVQSLSLEPYGYGYGLVMEDVGSISLSQYAEQQILSLAEILEIAIQLADILHDLHQHRVIHKDIKLANILIHPDSKQVKLIDFSIASLLPKETQTIQSPRSIEGTLAYLAPEQTGRMNRAIDYRTDFYSLGVSLYQLLTGQLPFASDDPLELIHCHMTQLPKAVDQVRSEIPSMIAAVVAKLMGKNAEDRYQSASGLKYDLENCLMQWRSQQEITVFDLGQRDLGDRFLIPEKLYGRAPEVQTLLDAFEEVAQGVSKLMLVAGFSGIGKTAVINEAHKPIVRQRGYFIQGKFDQFNRNIPFSAFVQAFRSLVNQLLSGSDRELEQWKTKILATVGEGGQVLIDVIPELELIIGAQPTIPELAGNAAQNRFNLLFQKFIAVFTTPEHPLVIFLDDLQWADFASLGLLKLLMTEPAMGCLLVLGAYRDNEVFPAHPLMLALDDIKYFQPNIHTLTLNPLAPEHINHLVSDTLQCSSKLATPLAELIYQKTQGNPFFSTQFLQGLHDENLITFDMTARYWQCDLAKIQQFALTDDVVEFVVRRLQKLAPATQEILKVAACIGNQFDLETLAIVCDRPPNDVAVDLWRSLQEGLILPENENYKFFQQDEQPPANSLIVASSPETAVRYRFLHDRVQQAAYSMIPDDERATTHYQIGKLLLEKIPATTHGDRIFELVGQLNQGIPLITEQAKRDELARLNLIACERARASTAYSSGREYARIGLALLGDLAWQRHYDISLKLNQLAAELASLGGDVEAMESHFQVVVAKAQLLSDQVSVYLTKIQALMAQGQAAQALATGVYLLEQLEVTFPEEPTPDDTQQAIADIKALLGEREIDELIHLPTMTVPETKAIVELANSLLSAAYGCGSPLYPLLVALAVKCSIQHGNTTTSAAIYASYGLISCNLLQDVATGVKFGELARQLMGKPEAKAVESQILLLLGSFIVLRNAPLTITLPLLKDGYTKGLELGNQEMAGYNAYIFCVNSFWSGQPLTNVEQDVRAYCDVLLQMNQSSSAIWSQLCWQTMLNLMGEGEEPTILSGEVIQETKFLAQLAASKNLLTSCLFSIYKMMLCYLFADIEIAQDYAAQARQCSSFVTGLIVEPAFYFYDSLIALALVSDEELNNASKSLPEALSRVGQNQVQLQRYWAKHAPMNYQHKVDLVTAEKSRILGQKAEAIDHYDLAIAGAKTNGFTQEEALANELAAKFYLGWGKEKIAASYMQDAYYCYSRWGARAKISELETHYSNLLRPVIDSSTTLGDVLTPLTTLPGQTDSIYTTIHQNFNSPSFNQTLDLVSILKASQVLAGTIQLDELLRYLTQIILQNSGADRCALVLLDETEESQVRAIATKEETYLCSDPLTNNPDVPVKLIQYVKNTQEVVLLENLQTDLPVIGDYLSQHQPKNALCLPVLNQGQLIGVLYLNNNYTSGVFTEERILILNFLCTQAAISIQNSLLYKELEQALQCAQQTSQELEETVALSQGQQRILALIAQGLSLAEILDEIALYIESQSPHPAYCSFLLLNAEGRLRHGAGPSLPPEYNKIIDGLAIGPKVGSCGTAAYFKASVTVTDIATDPLWVDFVQLALDFGLRACASTPILGSEGQVLATLAMYQPEPSQFTQHDRQLTEVATYLARIAIERHQADLELQQLNLQIIQGEKMASLGNLVAGVAHEVNNPVGFLNGSVNNVKEYMQDLFEYLELYHAQHPPNAAVKKEAEDIDLDFLLEDFPKLLNSMVNAANRIMDISTSLRTFSRADKKYKISANLHEGLNSTLLILKYRLKANDDRPEIKVVKHYGDLPEIKCFPGQINQVFMNLLANAIDMFDEVTQEKASEMVEKDTPVITIQTSYLAEENIVEIRISDNGKGMPEIVQSRIFDHLFTTKGVGKGTGLGLAIAHQIITEKHEGKIEVRSKLGEGTEFKIYLSC